MDDFFAAVGQSVAHAGPEYVTAVGVLAIAAWVASKAMPLYASYKDKRLDIERERERRKAAEEDNRERRDRERSEMEGRWLEQYEHSTLVQEQTNAVIEGIRAQMAVLDATLADSKDRSREMARQVSEIHGATVRR